MSSDGASGSTSGSTSGDTSGDSNASDSFVLPTPPSGPSSSATQDEDSTDADEVVSLPSSATTSTDDDSLSDTSTDVGFSDADREWRESLQQLELLLTMVVVPYVGKYFGRKAAYWGWARFMTWKYPVEIAVTSPRTFKAAGAVEAAATL